MSALNRLAWAVVKAEGSTWAEAFGRAWATMRDAQAKGASLELVTFEKKDGSTTTRVVTSDWPKFSAPRGGSPRPDYLRVVADLAKVATGKQPVISYYRDKEKARIAI